MSIKISPDEIKKASKDDYDKQTKYDDGFDRRKGFEAGVEWVLKKLNNNVVVVEDKTSTEEVSTNMHPVFAELLKPYGIR